jgi:hypothetical protein
VLITALGVATLAACLLAPIPAGFLLALIDGVLALVARGTNRLLLVGFAIAGIVLSIVMLLFLAGASTSIDVGEITKNR